MRSLRRAALLSVLGATVWGVYRLHTLAGELEHKVGGQAKRAPDEEHRDAREP